MSTFSKAIQQTVNTVHVDQVSGSTSVLYEPAAGTWALVKYGWMSANATANIISCQITVQGYNSLLVTWHDLFTYSSAFTPTLIQPTTIIQRSGEHPEVNKSGYAQDPNMVGTTNPSTSSFTFSPTQGFLPPFIKLFPEMRMVVALTTSPLIGVRHSVQVISYKSANNGV